MANLSELLNDPDYVNANEATKAAIFAKYAPSDDAYTKANAATQAAIRGRFGVEGQPGMGPQGGLDTGLYSGYQQAKSAFAGLAGRTGLMSLDSAKAIQEEAEDKRRKAFKPSEKSWAEDPLNKIGELIGQSAPFMVAPIVAGGVATFAGAPALVAAGLGGLASATQFTATNLARQQDTGVALEDTKLGNAVLASIPQAAFETISFRMMPIVQKIFGAAGKPLTAAEASVITQQGLFKTAGEMAKTGVKVGGTEGLTEVGQQFFERLQAGLNIADKNARDEYLESFVSGAILGSALSLPGVGARRMEAEQVVEANKPQTFVEPTTGITMTASPIQLTDPNLELVGTQEVNGLPLYIYAPKQETTEIEQETTEIAPPVAPPVAPPEGVPSDVALDQAAMEEEFRRSQGQLPLAAIPELVQEPAAKPVIDTIAKPTTQPAAPELPLGAAPESADQRALPPVGVTKPAQPAQPELVEQPITEPVVQEPVQVAQPPLDPNVQAQIAAEAPDVEAMVPNEPPLTPKRVPKVIAPKAGEKILSAHEYIASLGGLNKQEAAEINPDAAKSNVRVGNKWLYASKGGLTASQAAEKLAEAGYIQVEDNNEVYRVINDSLVDPVYSINDADAIAERKFAEQADEEAASFAKKEAEAGVEAQEVSAEVAAEQAVEASDLGSFRQQMLDAGYTEQDLNVIGFTKASPELQAEVAALEKQVSEAGLDPSEILEVLSKTYGDQLITKQEYYAKAKDELAKAIREKAVQGGGRDVSKVDVQEGATPKATESLDKFLEKNGFTFLPSDSKRNFQDFPTFEKNGVRVALSDNALGYSKGRVMMITPFGKFANSITVQALIVDQDKRNQGKAREVMQLLSDRADDTETTLYVEPLPINDKSVKTEGLKKFYASLGFEPKGEKIMVRNPGSKGLVAPTETDLKAKQEATDKAAADKARADREADAKAKSEQDRKDIAARSEKAAGEFELGKTAEEDLTGQKDIFSTPVQISPEQQKIDALNKFEKTLSNPVPPFRAASSKGTSVLRPKPLNSKQIELIRDLAGEAIDLGMPASLLEYILAAGATRINYVAAIAPMKGWLILGKDWSSTSRTEKLTAIIHEFGHSVDNAKARISEDAAWQKANDELKQWHDSSTTKKEHPLAYPFDKQFNGKVILNIESFAQSFALYFVSPVELETNAPEAYSQIKSIVEGIQNESQRASAASATKTSAAGVEVQPSRTPKGAAVQSDVGKVGSGVSKAERIKDRNDQDIDESIKPSQPNLPGIAGKPKVQTQIPKPLPGATWTNLPDMTRKDEVIIALVDKNYNLSQTQKAIEDKVGKIKDDINAYRKEALSHGRAESREKDFYTQELLPIIKEMKAKKISDAEMTEYLVMRHAKEANDLIAKRNPNNQARQDNGVGVTYKQREEYFRDLDPSRKKEFEALASKVDALLKKTRDILEDGGVIDAEERKGWEDTFKFYVPTRREESDFLMPSSGYRRVGDFAKSRVGSSREVVDVLSNIAINRLIAINRVEKERIGRAFYGLTLMNPNPEYFMAVSPDAVKNKDVLINEIQDQFGMNQTEAEKLVNYIMTEPTRRYYNKETGEVNTVTDVQAKYRDYVLPVKLNGKDRFVFANPKNPRAVQMVQSLRGLDVDQLTGLWAISAPITRWFSAVNTQYNLIFGAWNFMRDIQGAQLKLTATDIADKKLEVFNGTFKAIPDIFKALRERNKGNDFSDKSDGSWSDFTLHGGKVGYKDQFQNLKDSTSIVQKELDKLDRNNLTKATYETLDWISNVNDVMENSTRLSAYRAALNKYKAEHKGTITDRDLENMKDRAADIAKNLTVNFNRKGTWGAKAGSIYAFFGASVQGTVNLAQTLRGPAGKLIMSGGIAIGIAQALALAMAGFDEDEPAEFIKQKNLIFPTGDGDYVMWPMPFGFNVFPNIGRLLVEGLIKTSKGKDASDKLYDTITMLANSFNPLGGGGLWQMITPTALDPLVALRENRDSFGRPISRESRGTSPKPGYTLSRDPSPSISQYLSEFINDISFGNKDKRGWVSPTADQLDYLAGQITGGIGREAMRVGKYAANLAEGKETPESQVPIKGKVVGSITSSQAISQRFYNNVKTMSEHEDAIKGRIQRRESTSTYLRENPEAFLWRRANSLENEISKINTRRRELIKKEAPYAEIKKIDDQKTRMMKQFNDQVRKLQ